MSIFTRFQPKRARASATGRYRPTEADLNPRVARLVRPGASVSPAARLGQLTEALRASPYRAVAVVDAPDSSNTGRNDSKRLVGIITEERLVGLLLSAQSVEERGVLCERSAASLAEAPDVWATTAQFATEVFTVMQQTGREVLPVVNADFGFLGFVSRSDLVQDLVRPFKPPLVGGMATPLGVYLTTGAVSGGAGTAALILTGMAMLALNTAAIILGHPVEHFTAAAIPASLPLPFVSSGAVKTSLLLLLPLLAQMTLFLLLIRLTPIAGFHAAEHQVVHALERSEPLLVENVRAMPRVHPRCGTNIVAGVLILTGLGSALQPFVGSFAFLVSGLLALAYWRSAGGWLQQNLTTKPATDAQIESGIRAARELLEKHGEAPYQVTRPHIRLWRMGMVQILIGYFLTAGILWSAGKVYPPLGAVLKPYTEGLFDGIV